MSVVTPSYNQGSFIRETIESVLSQDYSELEYLIMDGGSTDETVEIIREYESDPRLRWTSRPDDGQAAAIREGFERSSGQVLAWLNSDDCYMPGAVTRAVAALVEGEAELVFGDAVAVDREGRFLRYLALPAFHPALFRLGWGIHQPSTFWHRDLYERVGGVNASLYCAMDRDLFCRMARETRPVHVRETLSVMRMHDEAKSTAEFSSRCYAEVVALQKSMGGRLPLVIPKALPRFHRYPRIVQLLLRAAAATYNTPLRLATAPRYVVARFAVELMAHLRSLLRRGHELLSREVT